MTDGTVGAKFPVLFCIFSCAILVIIKSRLLTALVIVLFCFFVVWGVASWTDFSFTIVHPPGTREISSNGK